MLTPADAFFADDTPELSEIPVDVPRHGGDGRPWIRYPGVDYDPSDDISATRKPKRGTFYSRASGVGEVLEDWYAVRGARIQRAVFGMSRRPELFYRAQALQVWDADRAEIRAITEEAIVAGGGLEAANRGTVFHELNEQRIAGGYDHSHLAEDMAKGLDVLARMLEPFEVLDTEQFVVWDSEGIAGSYDMRLRIRRPTPIYRGGELLDTLEPGEVVIADLKSNKEQKYHGPTYGIQQLPYACGVPYSHREGRRPWPSDHKPSQRWALIPHVPLVDDSDAAGLYWVDLDAARQRLEVVKAIKAARKIDDLFLPYVEPLEPVRSPLIAGPAQRLASLAAAADEALAGVAHAAVLEAIELAADRAAIDELWERHEHEWRDEWTAAVHARLAKGFSNGSTEVRTS